MTASNFPTAIILTVLVPLTIAGYALIEAGFARVRGAGFAIFSSLIVVLIAAVVYCVFGSSLAGYAGGSFYSAVIGGKTWDWLGCEPILMRGMKFDGSDGSLATALQIFTVGLAALIPLSSGADRWRLRSICISTALFAGLSYPLFAHWAWGGGWLQRNGLLAYGFLDPGGASTIHVMGGLSALAMAWILRPRRGKYTSDGQPAAIPAHNIVYVLFGCLLLLPGWVALNSVGAMLFAGAAAVSIPLIVVNTLLCAATSCLAGLVVTGIRFLKPDASLCANAWVGGLVASSAVCYSVSPLGAMLTGLIAGLLVTLSVELIEVHLRTDDPCGAVSVHAVAGAWGLLAVGIFPQMPLTNSGFSQAGGGGSDQMLAQVVGIATLIGVMLPLAYGLNRALDLFDSQSVEPQGERRGMDMQELGGVAYPDFVIHPEE